MELTFLLMILALLVFGLIFLIIGRGNKKSNKKSPLKTYKREFLLSFQEKFKEKPLNFCNVSLVIQNQESQFASKGMNPKLEKAKTRIKGLSKGDDRLQRREDESEVAFKLKTDNKPNANFLSLTEKENLNILLGFILRKMGEEEKRSKEDQHLSKLRNFHAQELIYVPQKPQSAEKENEQLKNSLSSVSSMESLKEAITLFTDMIMGKKPVDSANYHSLAKLCLRYDLLQWAGFFIKEMQKHKIEIQREILDDFLNLSFVIKTMSNLDSRIPYRKNHSVDVGSSAEGRDIKKKSMVYRKENDWVGNKEEEITNVRDIWEKFKTLNVNAESFVPMAARGKSMTLESECFLPQKKKF